MKPVRAAAALFAVFCICLLSACGAQAKKNDFYPLREFTRDFTLTKGEFTCGGTVTCRAYDDIRVEFAYPEGLSYFNVSVTPEAMRAQIGDVSDALLLEELPANAALRLFIEALRTFVYTNVGFAQADGARTCEAVLAGLTVRGAFSPDGVILRIDCDGNGLQAEFSE